LQTTATQPPTRPSSPARRAAWAWARVLGGVAILAVLLWRLGTGPFLDGLRVIDVRALAVATAIGALTTVGCAWRWRQIARGLRVRLPLGTAVAAYYRSQFLNTVLPGGVLGDVHRAVRHGQQVGDLGRGIRAAVLDRFAGQLVQVAVAVVVLLALPSPVRAHAGLVALVVAGLAAVVLLVAAVPRSGGSRLSRVLRGVATDLRDGLLNRRTGPGVALASTVVVAGHLATFLLAARTAGATAPLTRLVPLGLLVLLAMGVPVNVGGFGPREGVAAWAFGAAGMTAALGVATGVVYGVLVLVASLPGAVVLFLQWRGGPRRRSPRPPVPRVPAEVPAVVPVGEPRFPVAAGREGVARG
jgi:uncharacterized membrane protein YbhN (UPF0104 family)